MMIRRVALQMALAGTMMLTATPTRAELSLRDAWLSGLAGYDSNVRRVSASSPPVGVTDEGGFRAVLNAGASADLALERFKASLVLQPYYIKYDTATDLDRLDFYSTLPATYTLTDRWSIDANDTFRYINFAERSHWNQTYNNLRFDGRYRSESGWTAAAHYRFMYRYRQSPNLRTVTANGVGGSAVVHVADRLSLSTLLRYDFESIDFIFPGSTGSRRLWVDVSMRYQASARLIVLGKYLFQDDKADFIFDSGRNYDKFGEAAEAAADEILQSIRFLEDRDFNYRKNLFVLLAIGRLGDRHLLEGFGLFQDKDLDERVLSVAGTPKRFDTTLIGQVAYSYRLTSRLHLFGYGRYEKVDSTDPDHEFEVLNGGVGLRIGRSNP